MNKKRVKAGQGPFLDLDFPVRAPRYSIFRLGPQKPAVFFQKIIINSFSGQGPSLTYPNNHFLFKRTSTTGSLTSYQSLITQDPHVSCVQIYASTSTAVLYYIVQHYYLKYIQVLVQLLKFKSTGTVQLPKCKSSQKLESTRTVHGYCWWWRHRLA